MLKQKKSLKTLLAGLFTAGVLCGTGVQAADWADPVTFIPPGDVQFKYNNAETIVDEEGEILSGIFSISSIGDPGGSDIYWAAGNLTGSELTGVFADLEVGLIDPTTDSGGNVIGNEIFFISGTLTMYNVAVGTYDPTNPGASIDSQICGGTCPEAWLTFDFVTGVVAVDNPDTAFDETTTTLFSVVTANLASPTGSGDGNLVVTGGTAAGAFAESFSLQSQLQSCIPPVPANLIANCEAVGNVYTKDANGVGTGITTQGWPIFSSDPVVGVRIPLPGTALLFGLGLLGLGFRQRR